MNEAKAKMKMKLQMIGPDQIELMIPGSENQYHDVADLTEALSDLAEAYPGQIRIKIKGEYGYSIPASLQARALELAGLKSFEAAKQIAKGYIVL